MYDLPLSPVFLEKAKSIVKTIKEDPPRPKKCEKCGDIFFFVSEEQMNRLSDVITKDRSDSLCDGCATKEQ